MSIPSLKRIKAVLIDPYAEEVRDVIYNGNYKQIHEHILADCFDVVRLSGYDDVYVDDEGLLKITPETKFFMLPDYPNPLAGRGLILGNDMATTGEGESIDCHYDAAYYMRKVQFLDVEMLHVFGYLR
jgi:hypothetical protein